MLLLLLYQTWCSTFARSSICSNLFSRALELELVVPVSFSWWTTVWNASSSHTLLHTATRSNTLQPTATHSVWNASSSNHYYVSLDDNRFKNFFWIFFLKVVIITTFLSIVPVSFRVKGGEDPNCNTLQHTATHCNTLQHTATHCNTLRYLAW